MMKIERTSSELPESEIARLVVARTFLTELENCLSQQYNEDYIEDRSGRVRQRFERQFQYVDSFIPVAWHYAALAAENLVPEAFRKKLGNPQNSDHNRQHLAHVGNNAIIGSTYDLVLPSFSETDAADAAKVLMFDSFTHDHLQIDRQQKGGHDYLGGVFTSGLMRLARLKWNLPFSERQENLAGFAVYWHSHPEAMTESIPPAGKLIDVYGEDFGINYSRSLLFWLKNELSQRGVNLESLSCRLDKNDLKLAKWLSQRLAAADKRASFAPPFLSVLRTMGTGEKPFIAKESLGKPLRHFLDNLQGGDVVTRTFFEELRDLSGVGFSAFELEWLKVNKIKKLDYLLQIASALANNDLTLLTDKYRRYCQEVIYEAFREKIIDAEARTSLLSTVPRLSLRTDFRLPAGLPKDLRETICSVAWEYQNAALLQLTKGEELRRDLKEAKMSPKEFVAWLTGVVSELKETSQLKVVGRHTYVPENIPVYCNSLGVVR